MKAPAASPSSPSRQREPKCVDISNSLSTLDPIRHEVNSPSAPSRQPETKRVNNTNSLSTLDPIHHEVMNIATRVAQPGMPGGNQLTMDDIILWQQDEAERQGELGFTMNFPEPSDFFRKPFITDPSSEDELPVEDENALVAMMKESHRAIVQHHQRKIIMSENGPLLAKTEKHVHQKLLDAGVNERELHGKSLRQKVVQLAELTTPPPKPNFVAILVDVASTGEKQRQILELNLPLKTSIAEVYTLLGQVVKALLAGRGFSYVAGGKWKYQLIDQSQRRLLLGKSLPLENDLDYKAMLRHVSKVHDGKAPLPVLTQDGLATPFTMRESDQNSHDVPEAEGGKTNGETNGVKTNGVKTNDEETNGVAEALDEYDDLSEILDEDGQPYFEPLDMHKMAMKYASMDVDLTAKNGIHGFWR